MKLSRVLFVIALVWLCLVPVAHADDGTPAPEPTPATLPTDTPPDTAPEPAATEPPVVDTTPVTVSRERSTPVVRVSQPGVTENTPVPIEQATPQPRVPGISSGLSRQGAPISSGASSGESGASIAPPSGDVTTPGDPSAVDPGVTNITSWSHSAQAPAQLTCGRKHTPLASPFLVSPYEGWTEVASFVDHDNPDYVLDGTIVIANGLVASASDGQESDLFPAYWSPSLRQYINYDGHNGYDLELSYQPVLAAGSGTVMYAGWNGDSEYSGYGLMVLINHHNGYVTLYGHLSQLSVKKGDSVRAGEQIGISGSTGRSSGPHLHFSVFHDCQVTDPYGWTGKGSDPLIAFNGQSASYLWLPGHDPLLLNPPPNWPSYPTGLHFTVPPSGYVPGVSVPPADRLLLLSLPTPDHTRLVTAGLAVARTRERVATEEQTLTRELERLKKDRRLESYQWVPSAAAVWVRGVAGAGELEALPGVASLAGILPRDVAAAQAGLAHAVLIQTDRQRPISLWPTTFRSSFHAWCPSLTVATHDAVVTGVGLPGKRIEVSLHRGSQILGAVVASSDPETGDFFGTIHDGQANAVIMQTGDIIEAESEGRTSRMRVANLSVRAHDDFVTGSAPPGATVQLDMQRESQVPARTVVVTADRTGAFRARLSAEREAGSLVVATMVDGDGNAETASAVVPGLHLDVGGDVIDGWSVASHPILSVSRGPRRLFSEILTTAYGGAFNVRLQNGPLPLTLSPGDRVTIGSQLHSRTVVVPDLGVSLVPGTSHVGLHVPSTTSAVLEFTAPSGRRWRSSIAGGGAQTNSFPVPSRKVQPGDTASVTFITPHGDRMSSWSEVEDILIHAGNTSISGHSRPGSSVLIDVLDRKGKKIAQGAEVADAASGRFKVGLVRLGGDQHPLAGEGTLIVRDGLHATVIRLHRVTLHFDAHDARLILQGTGVWRVSLADNKAHREVVIAERAQASGGHLALKVPNTLESGADALIVSGQLGHGVTVERTLRLGSPQFKQQCIQTGVHTGSTVRKTCKGATQSGRRAP